MKIKLLQDTTILFEAKVGEKSQELLSKYPQVISTSEDIQSLLAEAEDTNQVSQETLRDSLDRLKLFQLVYIMSNLIRETKHDISLHREH